VASTYAERPNGEAMRRGHVAKPNSEIRPQRPDGKARWRSQMTRPSQKLDYKRLGPFK
jgi:hypothetical protein